MPKLQLMRPEMLVKWQAKHQQRHLICPLPTIFSILEMPP